MNIDSLLRSTGALLEGHFRLSSGLHSAGYVQCARLLMDPSRANQLGSKLADQLRGHDVELIVAPAMGGLIIGYTTAQALETPMIFTERKDGDMSLRRGFSIERGTRIAIIEDVVTTGKSTRETISVVEAHGGDVVAVGSILNRSGEENPFDLPYHSLRELSIDTWQKDECPLCAEGREIESPGSRFSTE